MNIFRKLFIILEGKRIERDLKPSEIDKATPPKELFNRIVQDLKDKGIWKEDESG